MLAKELITAVKRRDMARIACEGALTMAAYLIAQRLAGSWGCDCAEWRKPPAESDSEKLARSRVKRG